MITLACLWLTVLALLAVLGTATAIAPRTVPVILRGAVAIWCLTGLAAAPYLLLAR